jgi:hypothetical protein
MRCEEVWDQRQASASLYQSISHLGKIGERAYCLELPLALVGVHNVLHVSQLKMCLRPPVDVVVDDVSPLDADLSYPEHPVKIMDRQD